MPAIVNQRSNIFRTIGRKLGSESRLHLLYNLHKPSESHKLSQASETHEQAYLVHEIVFGKWLFPGDDFPKEHSIGVYIGLVRVRFGREDLRCHVGDSPHFRSHVGAHNPNVTKITNLGHGLIGFRISTIQLTKTKYQYQDPTIKSPPNTPKCSSLSNHDASDCS